MTGVGRNFEVGGAVGALLDRIEAGGLVAGVLSKKVLGYELYCEINKMPISQDAVEAFQVLEGLFKGDTVAAEKLVHYFMSIGSFFQEPPTTKI